MPIDENKIFGLLTEGDERVRLVIKELQDHRDEIDVIMAKRLAAFLEAHIDSLDSLGTAVCSQLWDGRIIETTKKNYEYVGGSHMRADVIKMWNRFSDGGDELRLARSSYKGASDTAPIALIRK